MCQRPCSKKEVKLCVNNKIRAFDLHANYKLMKLDMQTKSTTALRKRNYMSRNRLKEFGKTK